MCSCVDYYDNTDYNETTETVATNRPVISEDDRMPTYAYYIIGIGGGVLLIVLTLVVFCFTYTCYVKYKNAKELATTSEDPWKQQFYTVSAAVYMLAKYSTKHFSSYNSKIWFS